MSREFLFRLDLCHQRTSPSVGPLTSFIAPADALLASVSDSPQLYTASPSVVPGAGTYTVGLFLDPIGGNMNDNGTANGWIMVTNGSKTVSADDEDGEDRPSSAAWRDALSGPGGGARRQHLGELRHRPSIFASVLR